MRDCKHGRMARKCEVCELEEEVNELRAQLTEAQQQCQQLLAERSKYGVMISYALQGQRHSDEPDGDHRLDAIRAMAATLSDCQHRLAAAEQAEPVAYAAFADNGNIRIWCADPIQAETLRSEYGHDLKPLYTSPPRSTLVDEFTGWYCAHCQRGVDSSEVTFHEQHQVCGMVITNDRPPPPSAGVPDHLSGALDNLLHDNYERSYSGSKNRHADIEMIRAALLQSSPPAPKGESRGGKS